MKRLWAVVILIVGIFLLLAGMFSYAVLETRSFVQAAEKLDLESASTHARRAAPVVGFFSFITAYQVPDLHVWRLALSLPDTGDEFLIETTKITQTLAEADQVVSIHNFTVPLQHLQEKIAAINQNLDRSLLLSHIISSEKRNKLQQAGIALSDAQKILNTLSTTKQTWVIIFQNSDELRATGGFPGSYALLTVNNGSIEELVVEDIYDADGQFTGFLEPPAGVREYTSGSRGMRLPDANWYPHFPKTAQTMLQFFALGNKRNIAGMITVNVAVGESLLRATGPVWLPDYSTEVNADNLRTVLREEREQFFPGSIQKKHILAQTFSVVKAKLAQLPRPQQAELFKTLVSHFKIKDVQVYANNQELQDIFERYGIDGRLGLSTATEIQGKPLCKPGDACIFQPAEIYLVESNVGINKANHFISRAVALTTPTTEKLEVTITFTNSSPLSNTTLLSQAIGKLGNPKLNLAANGYADYQRILLSPEYKLEKVTSNDQEITAIDQETVMTGTDLPLTQYGFLVTVVPESTKTVELTFTTTNPQFSLTNQPLLIQKQSGLPPTSYTIATALGEQHFLLERDTLITWK